MKTFIFTKENGNWFVNFSRGLKEFNNTEFAMIDGAATLLDTLSNGRTSLPLKIDNRPFRHATVLELEEAGAEMKDDGRYSMRDEQGNVLQQNVCLSELALLVFGDIPERFYIFSPGMSPVRQATPGKKSRVLE